MAAEPTRPLPECPDTDYEPCDIRKSECQTWLASIAACMRGSKPLDGVPIVVMSEDDYAQVLLEDWADYVPPQTFHSERARSLFGLTKPSSFAINQQPDLAAAAKDQAQHLGGVYRDAEKRVVIVDHGVAADDPSTDWILLHELVHALQDIDYDLSAWENDGLPYTFDHGLAQAAVFEGEARFYENRFSYPLRGYDIRRYDVAGGLINSMRKATEATVAFESPYEGSRSTFPYALGSVLSFQAWQVDGPPGIAKIWATPPNTTQAVIASVIRTDEPQRSGLELAKPDLPDLSLFSDDVLGGWGVLLFAGVQGADWTASSKLAASWRGDHFWVFTDDTDLPTYALWEVEFGDEAMAAAFDADLIRASDKARSAFDHGVKAKRVFASAAFSDAPLPALTDAGNAWLSGN